VIEYGADRQSRLLAPLGLDSVSPALLVSTLFLVVAVLGAIIFPLLMRIRGPGRKDPILQLWRQFLQKLKKAGVESLASDGAMELAVAASHRLPADSAAIIRVADLYTRSRYAPAPPPISTLRQAVHEFQPK
jgi:hypothetical protein